MQVESLARRKRKRAERRRDARKAKQAQRASNFGSAVRATSSRGEQRVGQTATKSAQAQEEKDDRDASLARFLRNG